jgi:mRNA degradation ribonuclease J1/J2
LTSSQSKDLLPNFSKLRIIDGRDYKKVGKNLINFIITKQELEDFLFDIRIVITGDFKFDWTEIGEKFDLVKLTK